MVSATSFHRLQRLLGAIANSPLCSTRRSPGCGTWPLQPRKKHHPTVVSPAGPPRRTQLRWLLRVCSSCKSIWRTRASYFQKRNSPRPIMQEQAKDTRTKRYRPHWMLTPDNEPSLSPSTNAVLDAVRDDLRSSPTRSARGRGDTKEVVPSPNPNAIAEEDESADKMDTDDAPPASAITPTEPKSKTAEAQAKPPPSALKERRPPPIPTRSTIAQSSFSWMLEPDVSPSAAAAASAAALATSPKYKTPRSSSTGPFSSSAPPSNRKRMPASRERNAFLFGEVTTPPEDGEEGLSSRRRNGPVTSEEIFGLEPLRKALPPS